MIASTMTQAAQDPDGMLSEALNKCTAFQPQRLYKENGSAGPEAYIFTASSAPRWTNRFPKDSVRNANSDVAPVEKAISPVVRPPTLGGITRYHDIPDFAFRGSLDEFLGTASPTRKGAVLDGEASDSELESPVECENDLMPDDIRPIRIDV
ncbi:MAG: uncharacterized protein KVP18_004683 [Porospora cf. gigantea A]|nr:MAG: hypothetical protein KVP18_004683 [Porospora cf. gigantea A]